MKYICKQIIIIIITFKKEIFACWLIEDRSPPKIVIIITKFAAKFKEFNSEIPKGWYLSSRPKKNEININKKKALFWYEIGASPTFTKEIIKIIENFLKRIMNSLNNIN